MTGWGLDRIGGRIGAYCAALALFMLVAVPPGFMVDRSDSGPTIVICTGHGPLHIGSAQSSKPGKAPRKAESGACVFAGHGGSAPVPAVLAPTASPFAFVAEAALPAPDLAPGRGLAAPPPPSQGPPKLAI